MRRGLAVLRLALPAHQRDALLGLEHLGVVRGVQQLHCRQHLCEALQSRVEEPLVVQSDGLGLQGLELRLDDSLVH